MRESLNKSQIERFSRQLVLKNIGAKGQKKILSSKILIVGVGGLGCPAAENLVRAGIGTIGLVDNDIINLSNIHRQSLFTSKDIKKSKVSVAAKKLKEINQFPNLSLFKNIGIDTSDDLEIVKNYIKAQEKINSLDANKIRFIKTHSSLNDINGYKFTDLKNTLGVIYVVRDPRSVVRSYANHNQLSLELSLIHISEPTRPY